MSPSSSDFQRWFEWFGPHPGEAVGHQLDLDGQPVRLRLADLLLALLDLAEDAELVLDVVADLVGEHVGVGEVAAGAEASAASPGRRSGRCRRSGRGGSRTAPSGSSPSRSRIAWRARTGRASGPGTAGSTCWGRTCFQTSSVLPRTAAAKRPASSVGCPRSPRGCDCSVGARPPCICSTPLISTRGSMPSAQPIRDSTMTPPMPSPPTPPGNPPPRRGGPRRWWRP